jgi:hypothetical protein
VTAEISVPAPKAMIAPTVRVESVVRIATMAPIGSAEAATNPHMAACITSLLTPPPLVGPPTYTPRGRARRGASGALLPAIRFSGAESPLEARKVRGSLGTER